MDLRTGISAVLMLVVFFIGVSIAATILDDLETLQCESGYGNQSAGGVTLCLDSDESYNATTNGLTGIDNVSSWGGTIGTVLGASIILTVLVGGFAILWRRG